MIGLVINITHKLLHIHFDVYFLFKFHNQNVNSFDDKNDTNYRCRNDNYRRLFCQFYDNSNKGRFELSKLIICSLIVIQFE